MWSWKAKTSSSGQPADDLWLKDIISDLNGEQQVKGPGPARGIHFPAYGEKRTHRGRRVRRLLVRKGGLASRRPALQSAAYCIETAQRRNSGLLVRQARP